MRKPRPSIPEALRTRIDPARDRAKQIQWKLDKLLRYYDIMRYASEGFDIRRALGLALVADLTRDALQQRLSDILECEPKTVAMTDEVLSSLIEAKFPNCFEDRKPDRRLGPKFRRIDEFSKFAKTFFAGLSQPDRELDEKERHVRKYLETKEPKVSKKAFCEAVSRARGLWNGVDYETLRDRLKEPQPQRAPKPSGPARTPLAEALAHLEMLRVDICQSPATSDFSPTSEEEDSRARAWDEYDRRQRIERAWAAFGRHIMELPPT